MNISTNSVCCGCGACEQICARKAISMQPDNEGFVYPMVNADSCTDCGLCSKVCPELHTVESLNPTGKAMAAQALDNAILAVSSSGGIFSVVANYILEQGGVVIGAELSDEVKVRHIVVDKKEDLHKLQGSKYAQSDTTNIYNEVKEQLQNGRYVFFTGTPCQVSALKLYLLKPYDNLLTSDLVCHGAPSPMMFSDLKQYLEKKYGGKLIHYQFRSKTLLGWSRVSACTMLINGKKKHIYYDEMMRAFFQSFLAGHNLRMDCYKCPFTRTERAGDITMADFWSLKSSNPSFPRKHRGVSMLLINSEKGKAVLDACKKNMYTEPSNLDIILGGNNFQLKHPSELTKERESIFDFMFTYSDKFILKYLNGSPKADKFAFYKAAIKEQIKKFLQFHGQY